MLVMSVLEIDFDWVIRSPSELVTWVTLRADDERVAELVAAEVDAPASAAGSARTRPPTRRACRGRCATNGPEQPSDAERHPGHHGNGSLRKAAVAASRCLPSGMVVDVVAELVRRTPATRSRRAPRRCRRRGRECRSSRRLLQVAVGVLRHAEV